jgi:hypothetical protein
MACASALAMASTSAVLGVDEGEDPDQSWKKYGMFLADNGAPGT